MTKQKVVDIQSSRVRMMVSGPHARGATVEVNGIKLEPQGGGLVGAVATTSDGRQFVVYTGPLQEVIRYVEEASATYEVSVDASALKGPSIVARLTKHRATHEGAVPYRWEVVNLGDAWEAYNHLYHSAEVFHGHVWAETNSGALMQLTFLPSDNSIEAETAWEILTHRLSNKGEVPYAGVPYDICPQCLSRHVVVGPHRRCQECLYEDT